MNIASGQNVTNLKNINLYTEKRKTKVHQIKVVPILLKTFTNQEGCGCNFVNWTFLPVFIELYVRSPANTKSLFINKTEHLFDHLFK